MPYITAQQVAFRRDNLKKEFPDYKFSVVRHHHSTIRVAILSGPLDLCPDTDKKYQQVNCYYISEHFQDTLEVRDMLLKVHEIINEGQGGGHTDADYGHVPSFYTDITIGKWDAPYEVTGAPAKKEEVLQMNEYQRDAFEYFAANPIDTIRMNAELDKSEELGKVIFEDKIDLVSLTRTPTDFPRATLSEVGLCVDFARGFYGPDISIYESFFIILLSQNYTTIGYAKISQGGVAGTVVDPIIIAKYAIDTLARAVVLVHNHPSGSLIPSRHDKELTKKITDALSLFQVKMADHVILTKDSYYSFAESEN